MVIASLKPGSSSTQKTAHPAPHSQLVELVEEKSEREKFIISDALKGFEVIYIDIGQSDSVMTIMGNMVRF